MMRVGKLLFFRGAKDHTKILYNSFKYKRLIGFVWIRID